jgi:hypothetical protein
LCPWAFWNGEKHLVLLRVDVVKIVCGEAVVFLEKEFFFYAFRPNRVLCLSSVSLEASGSVLLAGPSLSGDGI